MNFRRMSHSVSLPQPSTNTPKRPLLIYRHSHAVTKLTVRVTDKMRAALIIASLVLCTSFFYLLRSHFTVTGGTEAPLSSITTPEGNYWPGWDGIEHLVAFGDSISTTHYNMFRDQPSKENPLGNPVFPGFTTSNGPNWLGFMTAEYNATFVKTVNFASGGATIDFDIVPQMGTGSNSVKHQVEQQWLTKYAHQPPAEFRWRADNSLFAIFAGNNDVRDTFLLKMDPSVLERSVEAHGKLMSKLYKSGSRNFLVMNILPFDLSPMLSRKQTDAISELEKLVTDFNGLLNQTVSEFRIDYPDANVIFYDANKRFAQLLEDPCSMKETCLLLETDTYCEAYKGDNMHEIDPYRFDESCEYPADKYFWLSNVHPGFRVHQAMAKGVVDHLVNLSWPLS